METSIPRDKVNCKFEKLNALLKRSADLEKMENSVEFDEDPMAESNWSEKTSETKSSTDTEKIIKKKIYIKNLEWNVHENLLKNFLSKFGKIKRCKIIRNNFNNKSKGIGFVEFYDEADVESILKASVEDLILNGRDLVVDYFKEKPRNSKLKNSTQSEFSSNVPNSPKAVDLNQGVESPTLTKSNIDIKDVERLPYNVLVNIFSHLCIRDLCIVELVCKRWFEIARITWSLKQKLVLNEKSIFENYNRKSNNIYGFSSRPEFNIKAFRQIFDKKLTNLKHFDISDYYSKFGMHSGDVLRLLTEECPNLSCCKISNMDISNKCFTPLVKKCKNLEELDISACSRLSDAAISKVFQHCSELRKIDLSNCRSINGSCFERLERNNQVLTMVTLDCCDNLEDEYLILLLSRCINLRYLSIKRTKHCSPQTMLYLINNSKKLETLLLTDTGFDCLNNLKYASEIDFQNLENLAKLDLTNSLCDNKLISTILKKMKSLKCLILNSCTRLSDDMFDLSEINSPLEDLNLSFIKHITDSSLESLSKVSSTLKRLIIKGCPGLSNEGIARALEKLSNLKYLDVRLNHKVDNLILETALSLNYRQIYIVCYDTSVDTNKFVFDHETASKETIERYCLLFKHKNLTFETSITKLNYEDKYNILRGDGGFYYLGSPLTSEDEDEDFGNFEPYYGGDDYDQEADLEEFMEEEQEMLKELDE